jgi:hypothetical protein
MEDDYHPKSLQEKLNEILQAFYALVTEDDIKAYQTYLESIKKQCITEGAVHLKAKAPDFELVDQDGDMVKFQILLARKGPCSSYFLLWKVVSSLYNSTLLAMQQRGKRCKSCCNFSNASRWNANVCNKVRLGIQCSQ